MIVGRISPRASHPRNTPVLAADNREYRCQPRPFELSLMRFTSFQRGGFLQDLHPLVCLPESTVVTRVTIYFEYRRVKRKAKTRGGNGRIVGSSALQYIYCACHELLWTNLWTGKHMVMTERVGRELRAEDISGERLENYSNVCSE